MGNFWRRGFQFHTGSIKRAHITNPVYVYPPTFQFHTGSIKSFATFSVKPPNLGRFNSILVRLKECYDFFPTLHVFVSIPYWFD